MINSMTGFGRYEAANNRYKLTVELRSVNHKYLDVSIKLPRRFNPFEAELRNLLKSYATRGKIDIFISYENLSDTKESLRYNSALAAEYFSYYTKIRDEFDIPGDISVGSIARSPDVLVLEEQEIDEEELWNELKPVACEAFRLFAESRNKEGESLKDNIMIKLDEMDSHVAFLEKRMPEIIEAYKQKLRDRMKD